MSERVHGGCCSSCCVAEFSGILHRALKLSVLVMSRHEDVASASPHLISKGSVDGWSRSELEFLDRICLQVKQKRSVLIVLFACTWVQRCPYSGSSWVSLLLCKMWGKKIGYLSMNKSHHQCTQMGRIVIFFNVSFFLFLTLISTFGFHFGN